MPSIITSHEAQTIRGCMGLLPMALGGVNPSQSLFRLNGACNHINWNAGHLVWSLDDTGVLLGLPTNLPPRFAELYAMGTESRQSPDLYPPIDEIIEWSGRITERVAEFIGGLDDEVLATRIPPEQPLSAVFPDWRELIASTGFHIGYHLGQIGMLRRVQGLPAIF